MSFLLLLALVLVAGFISIQISLPFERRNPAQTFLLIGLILIGLGLISELVLGFALDETAVKVFYWARSSVALAWLGQSLLLYLNPNKPWMRWLSIGILIGSIALFVLVFSSHITAAVDWYSTSRPIYSQIVDLLATNRPTRWGALALNLYGVGSLMAGCVYVAFNRKKGSLNAGLHAFLVALGVVNLFEPLFNPPTEANLLFFLVELTAPILIFIGIRGLLHETSRSRQ